MTGTNEQDLKFMRRAIALAEEGMSRKAGGPFGAVVVRDGVVIAGCYNCVTSQNDPTAHAEVLAIREACRKLGRFQLSGCVIYTSCEPCPMCLGAIYWARPDRVVYACTKEDAAAVDFDDHFVYREIELPVEKRSILFNQLGRNEALLVFEKWKNNGEFTRY
ncbi:tRNA(Arg) A34 adenosine deaminase TadA [Mangrovibacterium marinum]|uniref:tRNA(Arg) A34 adenosine deaminase TadA n=2 Tax=Mangrovibacterium marinum TaxID=1639118 RepID=A0A2T5C5W6_9BACT|nr:tRNA(Arg) A34 adenosine deaminase TadA [Mangrovibacterium marinum]